MHPIVRPPAVVLALAGFASEASAATLTVGEGYATVDDAILAAVDGDVIALPPGTWPVEASLTTRELTFVGTGGPAVTTLTSVGTAFVLVDSTVTVQGVTVEAEGRAFDVSGGVLTLDDVQVTGNASGLDGGALYGHGADVALLGVRFVDNGVSHLVEGGHVHVAQTTLLVADSVLTGGLAHSGTHIAASASDVTIERSVLAGGMAAQKGGSVSAVGGTLTIVDSRLFDNAAQFGGDLSVVSGTLVVTGSQLARGEASDAGGAIYLDGSLAEVHDSDVLDTFAVRAGASIRALHTTLTITGSLFARGTVVADDPVDDDGGIVNLEFGSLTVAESAFVEGWSGDPGSAAIGLLSTMVVTDSLFARNTVNYFGGTLYSVIEGSLTVERSWFVENTAPHGSGVLTGANAESSVRDNVFIDNVTTAFFPDGGSVVVHDYLGEVVRNYICGSEGPDEGSSLEADASWNLGRIDITNNIIANGIDGNTVTTHNFEPATVYLANNDWLGNQGRAAYASEVESTHEFVNALIAFTDGTAFDFAYVDHEIWYTDLWQNTDGYGDGVLRTGTFSADPLIPGWDPAASCLEQRFERDPASPLIDAGDPAILDPDGTVSDIGAFGGPGSGQGLLIDGDGDGYPGYVDCDDADTAAFPGASERCNRQDDDCDGYVDEEDAIDPVAWLPDLDLDGYGDDFAAPVLACAAPDPAWLTTAGDCDDLEPRRHLGAREVCDAVDDDCDGLVDEDAVDMIPIFPDDDGDGFGAIVAPDLSCDVPVGYAPVGEDCDDTLAQVFPGADEVCDGLDGDCDGSVDEDAIDAPTWFVDADGDGAGDALLPVEACDQPSDAVASSDDCDAADPTVAPGLPETCDGRDEDCDAAIDEEAIDAALWYADLDGDGHGSGDGVGSCEPVPGHVLLADDCDDYAADVRPGVDETCDGRDEDCDGIVDEDPVDPAIFFADADADGFGSADDTVAACAPPDGYVTDATDCNDDLASIHPGAEEDPHDGIDADCAGGAEAPSERTEGEGEGCGCVTSGTSPVPLLGLAALLLAVRRRR